MRHLECTNLSITTTSGYYFGALIYLILSKQCRKEPLLEAASMEMCVCVDGAGLNPNLLFTTTSFFISLSFSLSLWCSNCSLMAQQLSAFHCFLIKAQQNRLFKSLITRFAGGKSAAYWRIKDFSFFYKNKKDFLSINNTWRS